MNASLEEKIMAALFLCTGQSNEILEALKPEWNKQIQLPLEKKLFIIDPPAGRAGQSLLIQEVFPYKDELCVDIDFEKFSRSFFIQPDLFIRLRPGKEEMVKLKLHEEGIEFETISSSCLALSNASKIDKILELDKEAIIQDYSSQRTGEYLPLTVDRGPLTLWDCCAGSGGKSIMAYDMNPNIELTVSDVRKSILTNLNKRFQIAGIKKYKSILLDLIETKTQSSIINNPRRNDSVGQEYSIIIADVPCTGSGTWSRTPEQNYFFDPVKIEVYASLQRKIISNIITHLIPGGWLVYITCSVFKKENEEIIEYCKEKFNLQKVKSEVLKGYELKADTMLVALLQKPL